jgi:hypothetical protein
MFLHVEEQRAQLLFVAKDDGIANSFGQAHV